MDKNANIWENCLEVASRSDIGMRRGNNQDSMAVVLASSQEKWHTRGHLFMVADGMGAHAAGELASKLATDTVPLVYNKLGDHPPPEALRSAVIEANAQIHSRGSASRDFRGMGTTATTVVLTSQGAIIAHVGDSRAYRVRGNRVEQMTFDHSLVWELRAAGQIPAGESPSYIPKNIITRSLGPNPEVQVDLEGPFPLEVGDTFLLCSDGLSGLVKDEEIGKTLVAIPPKEAVALLVDLANLRGGPDNITVVVARVTGPQAAQKTAASPAASQKTATSRKPIHSAVWGVIFVVVLAALGLAVAGYHWIALATLAVAVVIGLVALLQRDGSPSESEFSGRPYGKGPYASWDCTPDVAFVTELSKVGQQLRDAASGSEWSVQWTEFNAHDTRAISATHKGGYTEAAREYCRAISSLMEQLRHQKRDHRSGNDTRGRAE
jgi:protein phosphatase